MDSGLAQAAVYGLYLYGGCSSEWFCRNAAFHRLVSWSFSALKPMGLATNPCLRPSRPLRQSSLKSDDAQDPQTLGAHPKTTFSLGFVLSPRSTEFSKTECIPSFSHGPSLPLPVSSASQAQSTGSNSCSLVGFAKTERPCGIPCPVLPISSALQVLQPSGKACSLRNLV